MYESSKVNCTSFFPFNVQGEVSKLKVITIEKQNYFKRYEFCPYKTYSSNEKSTEHFYYVYEKYKTLYLLEFSLGKKLCSFEN